MSCNCGGNDYNISIGNNGNCEPSTPEYYISLGGVGVNGYSPVVNFVNQTEQSFSIEVDDINGINVSDPVPKLSYVSDQLNNINISLENKLNVDFSNSPSTISFPNNTQNIKANRLRLYTGDYYYSGMSLQLGQTSGELGYYSGKHLFLKQDKIHYSVNTTSDDNEIATIGNIPTKTSDLTNDSGFITSSDLPTVGNGTITITQGGVTKGTFTTNQSGNTTIELDEGGGVTNPLTITDEVSNNFLQFAVNDSGSYIRTGTQGLALNGYLINTVDNPLSLNDVAFGLKAIALKYDNDTIKVNQDGQLYADVQGGTTYTAGTGIDITNDTISVDNTVAMKTDIPTVNNGTVTINQGGTQKGTFTLNQSGNVTINLDAGGSGGGAVDSVNGQTGDVVLDASDVGALPDTTVIPTKTSDLTNDSNFATVSQIPTNNNQLTNGAGYITASALNGYAKTADLATVATSGSYNDLSDKPTIPSAVTESTVSDWGFTKNTGTVTSVNNVSPVNGNVTLVLPSITNLANKDLSNLSSKGNSKFQTPLVSGTNIKTINNTSLLGSGNIAALVNTATKSTSLTIGDNASTLSYTTNVGIGSQATATAGQAFGHYAIASGQYSLALGQGAEASSDYAIQLGKGTNSTAKSLMVGFGTNGNYQLLDGATGLIPDARISSNIARANDIPDVSNLADTDLSNLSTTGQAVIDGKVSKSGDTMTGALKLDMTNVGSTNDKFQDITFVLDDIRRAGLRCSHLANGTNRVEIIVRDNSDTLATGYTAINNNGTLSCSFPNTTCVDGQWVNINTTIMNNVNLGASSTNLTYTLSDVPNDGHAYEVLLSGATVTGSASGNYVPLNVRSDKITNMLRVCQTRTRTSSTNTTAGSLILPLTTSRKIYVERSTEWNGTGSIYLRGYRRIGSNS